MTTSPIADLTYRNYDGPLEPPLYRWWAIARACIRLSLQKKGFWIWSTLSAWWYIALIFIFYVADSFSTSFMNQRGVSQLTPEKASMTLFQQVRWPDQFLHAFSFSQLLLFVVALLIGVGAIANDNRANALLVYLSKPCTKTDYLLGKWLSVFIPITAVVGVPMLFFYGYCAMSYRQYGFMDDPWLILKLVGVAIVPGFVHASLSLGISSMFKQGRLAGATYAGLYFITMFFTKAMQFVYLANEDHGRSRGPEIVGKLFYCSIDGLQIGMAKSILHTNGGAFFPFSPGFNATMAVPAPSLSTIVLICLGICGASMLLAWTRVRAVEVVS